MCRHIDLPQTVMPARKPFSTNRSLTRHLDVYSHPSTDHTGPGYKVKVEFRDRRHDTLEPVGGRSAIAEVTGLTERSRTELWEDFTLPRKLSRAITLEAISAEEWENAVSSIKASHGCENPYCALIVVAGDRLKTLCTTLEQATRAQERFGGCASVAISKVSLEVPTCVSDAGSAQIPDSTEGRVA